MKCDELKRFDIVGKYRDEETMYEYRPDGECYDADEVDAAIAELKAENERLNNALDKERSETIKYMDELCNAKNEIERLTIDKRNAEQRADVADATAEKLKAENECLKQKLEDVQATAYTESVDAGMTNKKLQDELTKLKAQMPKYKQFIEDEDYRKKLVDEYAGYVYEWAGHRYIATPYINVFIKGILRTLYKALANWAKSERYTEATWHGDEHREELWAKVQDTCLKKAEEYK